MRLTLMTWNVENLFQPEMAAERDSYAQKLTGLADCIMQHKPHVVALQEVGSLAALQDLLRGLGDGWHYALSKHPDNRGIRVGFISRLPFSDVVDVTEIPPSPFPAQPINDAGETLSNMGRGALAATVIANGQAVRLVNTHLKSKLITYPGGRFSPRDEFERTRYQVYALNRRAGEAAAMRHYCTQYLQGQGTKRRLVLLGDMNDEPNAQTTMILYGPSGSQPGTRGAKQPDTGDTARLFNLTALLPKDERQTRVYHGQGEIIDHILVSRALFDAVVQDSVRAPAYKQLPSITDNPADRPIAEPSDHAPVITSLEL